MLRRLGEFIDLSAGSWNGAIEATYPIADPTSVLLAAFATIRPPKAAGYHADPQLDSPLQEFVAARLKGLSFS